MDIFLEEALKAIRDLRRSVDEVIRYNLTHTRRNAQTFFHINSTRELKMLSRFLVELEDFCVEGIEKLKHKPNFENTYNK